MPFIKSTTCSGTGIFFVSLFCPMGNAIGVPLCLAPSIRFGLRWLCSVNPFLPRPIIKYLRLSSISNNSRASLLILHLLILHTGTTGRSGAGGFEYPTASFASRRVPQNPGPRTPVVPVCYVPADKKRVFNIFSPRYCFESYFYVEL